MGKQSISSRRILLLCTTAYASIYIARLNLSVASPLFEESGMMTTVQIGLMGSVFFVVYAAGRLLNGVVGDALPAKKLLIVGLAAVAVSNLAIGLLPPVVAIISLWGFNGLAQSMLWGPALRLVGHAYEGSPFRQTAAVILSSSIGIGSLLAIALSSALSTIGLRVLFIVPGLMVLAAALLMTGLPAAAGEAVSPHPGRTAALLRKRDILCMLFPSAAHGIIKENLVLWAPLLFMHLYGFDLHSASFFAFFMPGAMLLGRTAYPILQHWCGGDERRVSIWSFIACILCMLPFFFWKLPVLLAAVLLAMTVLAASVINVAFMTMHPLRYEESHQVSMAAGLLDGISYIGSAVGSMLFGWIIGQVGYMPMLGVYVTVSLISVFSLLPTVPNWIRRKKQQVKEQG